MILSGLLVVAPVVWASEGSSVFGGGDQRASDPGGAPGDESDVLRGPRAREAEVPGATEIFSPGMNGRDARGANTRQIDRWLEQLVRDLQSDEAPESVRTTDDQRAEIKGAFEAQRERTQAYRREHAEELRSLREKAGYRQEGGEPTPEMREARTRLREINQGAPSNDQLRGEVWAILTEDQRTHINAELERMTREAQAGDDAMMGMRGGDAGRDETLSVDERVAQLLLRLDELPEAQRGPAIDRLLTVLERFERAAQETRRRAEPPAMDGVDVPESDEAPRRRRDRRQRDAGERDG